MTDSGNVDGLHLNPRDMIAHQYDSDWSMYNGYEGGKFAKPIQSYLSEHGLSMPPNPQLLGLGAGVANPECALADQLEIPYTDVTLVDKRNGLPNSPIFCNQPEDIEYVTSRGAKHRAAVNYLTGRGLFHYLENPDRSDFSVVTVIGVEYVLEDPQAMQDLINTLPNVLLPNGFVCLYPYNDNVSNRAWEDQGFVRVENLGDKRDYSDTAMYVYANPVRQPQTAK